MSSEQDLTVVLDCGATNIRAVAVNRNGEIVYGRSLPNGPVPQTGGEGKWLVWDIERVWEKICRVSHEVCLRAGKKNITGVTVVTFGADGAPVDRKGSPLYPVISWKCSRGRDLATKLEQVISPWEVYQTTGYQFLPFNTVFRMLWLKRNHPEALENAHKWLMLPGIINYRLSGEFAIDPTSASTMMVMDLKKRDWWDQMLKIIDIDASLFPPWKEPGEVMGKVTPQAHRETGIPQGTEVVVGGHDTQFAALGAGGSTREAILSSGTWEILLLRIPEFKPTREGFEGGLIVENDALPELWNPQVLMIASGVLEWVKECFYGGLRDNTNVHEVMISEGKRALPGARGVRLIPEFCPGTGPARRLNLKGTLLGLGLATQRGEIYRGALEGLSFQLRQALELLQNATERRAHEMRIVGGGARNRLWNQIRAEVTGLPLASIQQKEATAVGAAMVAFLGTGTFGSIEEGQRAMSLSEERYEPTQNQRVYEGLYQEYVESLHSLKRVYGGYRGWISS